MTKKLPSDLPNWLTYLFGWLLKKSLRNFKYFHVFKIYPTSRYENQCQMLESIFVVSQDSRNLPCEADGKNPGKDIGSKGIGAFWPWLGPNIGQNGVIKWRFFESFAKILHCVCTRIASRQILFCPIPIPTSERPFMDTRTKNTIKNWVCTRIMVIRVVEFSSGGYKIRKMLA